MIDDEEPTTQRPPTHPELEQDPLATTIQVPLEPEPQQASVATAPELQQTGVATAPEPQQTDVATTPEPQQAGVATAPAPPPSLPYMTIDDLLSLKIVGDPQISPDGASIAFSVQHCNAEQNTTGSAIWLVNSTGGKTSIPRKLTSGDFHDTTPRWSPDGQWLAFISDRSGSSQIHLLPINGGESRQLSSLSQGVSEYSWRPDGQVLLVHSAWKPADDQSIEAHPQACSIYTRLGDRWNGEGYKHGRHQQLWLLQLDGTAQRLTSEPVDLLQSCWSPDGTEIAFCANRRPDPDLSVSMALWVLTVATGQMRRLTPEEGLAQMPAWSPDGQSIAYLYTADQTEAGNISPWLVDAQNLTVPHFAVQGAENLTCQAWITDELRDEWLAFPVWYPDGKALLVPAQERGQVHLYRLDIQQDSMTRLTSGNGRYISPQISKDGSLITMVRADWFTPGDIWSMHNDGSQLRKLTKMNDSALQSHQLIRPKRITWQSSDGLEIEGWLYLPALAEQAKAPLIVAPHGGPSLAWGDGYVHEFQVLAGRGYAVFAPNPRGSAGYGEQFCRQVLNDWGGADFLDIMSGIDHLIAHEPIDEQRLGIQGLSYGGYMTNWAITQTQRFKAAVSRNGISSLTSATLLSDQTLWFTLSIDDEAIREQRSPLTHADNIQTPLLLLHAEDDLRCPFSEALQLFVSLRKRKQLVELVAYHGISHLQDWPTVGAPQQRLDRLRRTLAWFERFL